VVSPSSKLRPPDHPGILVTLPDESRYGENRGKKKRLSEEKAVGEMLCWGGEEREEGEGGGGGGGGGRGARGEGRTCVRACVHAPFDLPPIA
jgi:hypothetical protein